MKSALRRALTLNLEASRRLPGNGSEQMPLFDCRSDGRKAQRR